MHVGTTLSCTYLDLFNAVVHDEGGSLFGQGSCQFVGDLFHDASVRVESGVWKHKMGSVTWHFWVLVGSYFVKGPLLYFGEVKFLIF